MAREPRRALDVATRALARRDFSARGLRERLQRAGIDPAEAEEALGALQRAGLVDDARFALARAQMLAGRAQRRRGCWRGEGSTRTPSRPPLRERREGR